MLNEVAHEASIKKTPSDETLKLMDEAVKEILERYKMQQ